MRVIMIRLDLNLDIVVISVVSVVAVDRIRVLLNAILWLLCHVSGIQTQPNDAHTSIEDTACSSTGSDIAVAEVGCSAASASPPI